MEGGLKDESSMKRVLGDSAGESLTGSRGCRSVMSTVFRTRNLEPDDWKSFSADASCGTKDRYRFRFSFEAMVWSLLIAKNVSSQSRSSLSNWNSSDRLLS